MRTKTGPNGSADRHVNKIKRKTRRNFSANEKIRIVLDGLRGESSLYELCRPLPGSACLHARQGRRDRKKPVLQLVEGLHGGGKEAVGW